MDFVIKNTKKDPLGLSSELERRLSHFTTLTHLECRWKVAGELILPEPDLPSCFGYHYNNRFCHGVKVKCHCESACVHNDSRELRELIQKRRDGFLHRCHAGVHEMIIPIGEQNKEPIGIIMLGPFRIQGEHSTYALMEEEYQKLPLVSQADVEAFLALIPDLFTSTVKKYYQEPTHSLKTLPTDSRLLKIFDLLKVYPGITAQELARKIQLSPSRLFHLFKQECQVNLKEFLLRYRLLVACRYLSSGNWSISQIALHMGFTDQSHFTRIFRSAFGTTPAKYRKTMQEFHEQEDKTQKTVPHARRDE